MDVAETVKDIILDILDVSENEVVPEANIAVDLGASSVQIIDLVAAVENEFNVMLANADIVKLRTVGDVISFIRAKCPD